MADLDTALKRFSGQDVMMPWRGIHALPDGTIAARDRQALTFLYTGILATAPVTTATLSGTITAGITEADIVAGGKTIIITLANDAWAAAGAAFDAVRQDILDGLTSSTAQALGWNNVVRLLQGVAGVVRTSNTVVTITLDAQPTYNIATSETVTATIPASALTVSLVAVIATPTFSVAPIAPPVDSSATPGFIRRGGLRHDLVRGEDDAEKRARRIREGTLQPEQTEPSAKQAREYADKSARLAHAIERFRGESATLRLQIERLEAAQAKRQSAKGQREILRKHQALQLASVQQAALLEQMEVLDVAYVAVIALGVMLQ